MADEKEPPPFKIIVLGQLKPGEDAEEELDQMTSALGVQFKTLLIRRQLHLMQSSLPFLSNPLEKKRRLKIIQKMCAARAQLESEGLNFGLALVDQALEAIIEGDWVECRGLARIAFSYSPEDVAFYGTYNERHSVLRELLIQAANEALPNDPMELTVQKGGAWNKT
jgi:hypothetical protein